MVTSRGRTTTQQVTDKCRSLTKSQENGKVLNPVEITIPSSRAGPGHVLADSQVRGGWLIYSQSRNKGVSEVLPPGRVRVPVCVTSADVRQIAPQEEYDQEPQKQCQSRSALSRCVVRNSRNVCSF